MFIGPRTAEWHEEQVHLKEGRRARRAIEIAKRNVRKAELANLSDYAHTPTLSGIYITYYGLLLL